MNKSDRPVALITGASRGIGAATAQELALRGYRLVLAARSVGELEVLAGELAAAGCPALPVPTDMRDIGAIERLGRLALSQFGRVDALIHNAGVGSAGPVARMADEAAAAIIMTNLLAPIELTRVLLPQMLERRRGAIVFVASVAGHIGLPGSSVYSASKFGLRGFAFGLHREVKHRGVDVTIVSPGFIRTAMTSGMRRIPMAPPDLVARTIADAIVRPRREIFVPRYYRPLVWAANLLPGLVDVATRWRAR